MNAPDYLHGIIQETVNMDNDGANKRRLWAVVLGLEPEQDGDHFLIVWGHPATGVVGCGKTPADAIQDFELAMYKAAQLPPR